jgi:cell division protein FtsI/penicillin-binding protein 2
MRRSYTLMVLVLTLAAGGVTACSGDGGPDDTVDAFLAGWKSGSLGEIGFVQPDGQKVGAADVTAQIKALSGELSAPELRREGDTEVVENVATAKVTVDWPLPGGARWSYPSAVRLNEGADGEWAVIWEPKIVQPELTAGDSLALRRLRAPRATITDGAGQPIFAQRTVINVGVAVDEVDDPQKLTNELKAAFDDIEPPIQIDISDLPQRIREAPEGGQVDVVQLRQDAYLQIKPRIYPLAGTKFVSAKRDLAPTRPFARALLGTVDEAFKEDVDKNPGEIAAGDLVGHGGVQAAFDKQLRGTAGTSVVVLRKAPDGEVTPASDKELFRAEPKPGTPVKTTLDVRTQNAADTALSSVAKRSAIVALRVSDGAVLAAANGPNGGAENLAFTAQVPPGSTFKMVSTLGLLDKGEVSLDGRVACPRNFTVDGRSFKNSNNFALGDVAFRVDFAKSCNTAFAALAPTLGDDGLAEAGRSLGLEGAWDLGVDAFSGKVSTGGSDAERAAAAFGQGTTIVSPLAMASATAAVAKGQWQQPSLLVDPAPAKPAAAGPALKASSLDPLRTMMREVVTSGTATALRDAPGGPVRGKTGTAEAAENTHGWFVGWQGDVAFAVFVENGGDSTTSAVPLARRFLNALNG